MRISNSSNPAPSQFEGSVSAYVPSPGSGALTAVSGSPFADGINPLSVVVDPTGRFAYVTATTYPRSDRLRTDHGIFDRSGVRNSQAARSGQPWTDSVQSNGSQLAHFTGASHRHQSHSVDRVVLAVFDHCDRDAIYVAGQRLEFRARRDGVFWRPRPAHDVREFVSADREIIGSDIDNGGTAVVFVFNPAPGGGASTSVEFPVFSPTPAFHPYLR